MRVVLRRGRERARIEPLQRLDEQRGAQLGEARAEGHRGVRRADRRGRLQQHVAGIEAGIDAHRGHAGRGLAVRDRPLDRRRATILWQQ